MEVISTVLACLLLGLCIYLTISIHKQLRRMENMIDDENEEAEHQRLMKYLQSDEFQKNVRPTVKTDAWDDELMMMYRDEKGNIVEYWKDGRTVKTTK